MRKVSILVFNKSGLDTARYIKNALPDATIWGLSSRVETADREFSSGTDIMRNLYLQGETIIGICASSILIQSLAPILEEGQKGTPVLAISEDGAAIVPLLGALTGANVLARKLSSVLGGTPAVTGSGARRICIALESPPDGYYLANPDKAREVAKSLLDGTSTRVDGKAPWLDGCGISLSSNGVIDILVTHQNCTPPPKGLLYHPRNVVIGVKRPASCTREHIENTLEAANISHHAVSSFLFPKGKSRDGYFQSPQLGRKFERIGNYPVKYATVKRLSQNALRQELNKSWASCEKILETKELIVAISAAPVDLERFGRPAGELNIIGTGKGHCDGLTLEAFKTLQNVTHVITDDLTAYQLGDILEKKELYGLNSPDLATRIKLAMDLAACGNHVALISLSDSTGAKQSRLVQTLFENQKEQWSEISMRTIEGLSCSE